LKEQKPMKIENLEPGMLIYHQFNDVQPRFCLVQNNRVEINSFWDERCLVDYKQPVMFVEKFDLTSMTSVLGTDTAIARWTAPLLRKRAAVTAVALSARQEATNYEQAKNEWDKNKKISGGIFLTRDCQKIWISYLDLEYFERANVNN
jgi:hypothetical protein